MTIKKSITVLNLRRVLKLSWPKKSYAIVEPDNFSAPKMQTSEDADDDVTAGEILAKMTTNSTRLTRSTSMTQSFRGAVGNIKQKLKRSNTKRRKLDDEMLGRAAPTLRSSSRVNHFVSASSIPQVAKTSFTNHECLLPKVLRLETPAKLRQDVESLMIDLDALQTLTTPVYVRTAPRTNANYSISHPSRRRQTKSPSPLTNGSLRPGVIQVRKRIETLIM